MRSNTTQCLPACFSKACMCLCPRLQEGQEVIASQHAKFHLTRHWLRTCYCGISIVHQLKFKVSAPRHWRTAPECNKGNVPNAWACQRLHVQRMYFAIWNLMGIHDIKLCILQPDYRPDTGLFACFAFKKPEELNVHFCFNCPNA